MKCLRFSEAKGETMRRRSVTARSESCHRSVKLRRAFPALKHANPTPIHNRHPMAVTGLNHFNITASPALIEKVKQFYQHVIGLTVGPRAELNHGGYWLYAGAQPILHLSARSELRQDQGGGKCLFNHISLSCVGLQATVSKLLAIGVPHQISELSDLGQTQIFMVDPAGIGVELTFCDETLGGRPEFNKKLNRNRQTTRRKDKRREVSAAQQITQRTPSPTHIGSGHAMQHLSQSSKHT